MSRLNQGWVTVFFTVLLTLFHSQAFGQVSNCRLLTGNTYVDVNLNFSMTSNTTAISPGTELTSQQSDFIGLGCTFTGNNTALNTVYFRNTLPQSTKELLLNSGVEIVQIKAMSGGSVTATITDPTVPDMNLGAWTPSPGLSTQDINISLRYLFMVIKGANALKSFDTGRVLLGYHTDYLGTNIWAPVYIHIKGDLVLLCPSPVVNVTASNGGSVGFGTVSPTIMNAGDVINKNFNLNFAVSQDCETGLNISVRFEPGNNTILDNKYLDMGNGLQTLLSNANGDINYNESYPAGSLRPGMPLDLPYTATLSKIPGSNVISGPFSKTIRVVVSY
ncbi:fimbrial protein [Yersinia intermedia]|uniref:fimbrial protein n=1 Tax=Yersinia intermedia TaxID=631 RepID=UPI0011AA151D|nr:fimbrial protein [Yersinia intermedia]